MEACLLTREPILINRQGIKEREESERGGGDYFKYFCQRGAMNRRTAIIRENTVTNLYL